jgi:hypothetical protein
MVRSLLYLIIFLVILMLFRNFQLQHLNLHFINFFSMLIIWDQVHDLGVQKYHQEDFILFHFYLLAHYQQVKLHFIHLQY